MFGRATITLGIGPHSSYFLCLTCVYAAAGADVTVVLSALCSVCESYEDSNTKAYVVY